MSVTRAAAGEVPSLARLLRAAVAALIVVTIVVTLVTVASQSPINPFNFFGFFTIQSNVILAAVYVLTSAAPRALGPVAASLMRACATTYIVIVGIVYATLLAPLGAAGGVPLPWANTVLHVVTPVYGVLDWFVFQDRVGLALRWLWVVLIYPLVWLVVVLVRGATDGWVPYPFLDGKEGYASVVAYCVAILVAFLAVGSVVFWGSRVGSRGSRRR